MHMKKFINRPEILFQNYLRAWRCHIQTRSDWRAVTWWRVHCQSYFGTVFRKLIGVTPAAYRAKSRADGIARQATTAPRPQALWLEPLSWAV